MTLEIRGVLRFLMRGAVPALILAAVAGVVAYVWTSAQAPIYRATVVVVATTSSPDLGPTTLITPPAIAIDAYRTALIDGSIIARAITRVTGSAPDGRALRDTLNALRVQVTDDLLSGTVRISFEHEDPAYATRLVETIASTLVAWDRERAENEARRVASMLEQDIAALGETLQDTEDAAARALLIQQRESSTEELTYLENVLRTGAFTSRLEIVEGPMVPDRAVGPRVVLQTLIAVLLGLVIGYGIVIVAATTNPRISSREELARMGRLPVFATFPRRTPGTNQLSSEASSVLRTRVSAHRVPGAPLIVVITGVRSASDQDGVAVGLAESFARIGDSTLLVDADLREARASAWLQVSPTQPTPYDDVAVARDGASLEPISVVVDAARSFDFFPAFAGADHPVDRLVRVFRSHAASWSSKYDIIVVDAAPALPYPDVLAVAGTATGVIVCARTGQTTVRDLSEALATFHGQGVPVLGSVLTDAPRGPHEAAQRRPPAAPRPTTTRNGTAGAKRRA